MNIGQHYQQHKILGTPSTKDNSPLQIPSFTETQRDDLTDAGSVANGMIIYNSTSHKFQGYANESWVDL